MFQQTNKYMMLHQVRCPGAHPFITVSSINIRLGRLWVSVMLEAGTVDIFCHPKIRAGRETDRRLQICLDSQSGRTYRSFEQILR